MFSNKNFGIVIQPGTFFMINNNPVSRVQGSSVLSPTQSLALEFIIFCNLVLQFHVKKKKKKKTNPITDYLDRKIKYRKNCVL